MSQAAHRGMTVDAFYHWVRGVEGRYELVDGEPVMMAGATNRHDRIVRNALIHVGNQLAGQRCQPFTADIFIAIPAGNRRHGDIGIDCGTPDDGSMDADRPTLVMEILSPTNRTVDFQDKIEDYKTIPTLEYILLVDPEFPTVRLWRRDADRVWIYDRMSGLEQVLDLPLVGLGGLRLPLVTLYAGLTFQPRPRLVGNLVDVPAGSRA